MAKVASRIIEMHLSESACANNSRFLYSVQYINCVSLIGFDVFGKLLVNFLTWERYIPMQILHILFFSYKWFTSEKYQSTHIQNANTYYICFMLLNCGNDNILSWILSKAEPCQFNIRCVQFCVMLHQHMS